VTDADAVREAIHSKRYPDALAALDRLVAERDEALARLSSIGGYEGYSNAFAELERERDEAKAQFWQQRHEWAAATGKNQEIIDGLLARAEAAEAEADKWCDRADQAEMAQGKERRRAEAAESERDEALDRWRNQSDLSDKWFARAEAAEAEVQRLRAFVTEFQAQHFSAYDAGGVAWEWQDKARAALGRNRHD
jgi:hypothetical protein